MHFFATASVARHQARTASTALNMASGKLLLFSLTPIS